MFIIKDMNVISEKKKRKKRKKKKVKNLGWGNPNYYGASPEGETSGFSSGDGGGMGENILRMYIRKIIENKITNK